MLWYVVNWGNDLFLNKMYWIVVLCYWNVDSLNISQIRIWSRSETEHQTEYALECAKKLLEYYEGLFGIPFPLPKQGIYPPVLHICYNCGLNVLIAVFWSFIIVKQWNTKFGFIAH